MSAENFDVSYSAVVQMALLPAEERGALERLFSTNEIERPETTRATGDGRFVSRMGRKRILWRRSGRRKPEILSIVDQSFAQV